MSNKGDYAKSAKCGGVAFPLNDGAMIEIVITPKSGELSIEAVRHGNIFFDADKLHDQTGKVLFAKEVLARPYRDHSVKRNIDLDFEPISAPANHTSSWTGNSYQLACAIAFARSQDRQALISWPSVAATGEVSRCDNKLVVRAVNSGAAFTAKLDRVLNLNPDWWLYPAAQILNSQQRDLLEQMRRRGIKLHAVETIDTIPSSVCPPYGQEYDAESTAQRTNLAALRTSPTQDRQATPQQPRNTADETNANGKALPNSRSKTLIISTAAALVLLAALALKPLYNDLNGAPRYWPSRADPEPVSRAQIDAHFTVQRENPTADGSWLDAQALTKDSRWNSDLKLHAWVAPQRDVQAYFFVSSQLPNQAPELAELLSANGQPRVLRAGQRYQLPQAGLRLTADGSQMRLILVTSEHPPLELQALVDSMQARPGSTSGMRYSRQAQHLQQLDHLLMAMPRAWVVELPFTLTQSMQ